MTRVLQQSTLNQRVRAAEYAVRGELAIKANELSTVHTHPAAIPTHRPAAAGEGGRAAAL